MMHAVLEVADDLAVGEAGRGDVGVVGGQGAVHQAVRAEPDRERRRRADRPFVGGHLQRRAVRALRQPPVDGAPRRGGERELVGDHVLTEGERGDGDGERGAEDHRLEQLAPPARHHDQHVDHGGDDQDLADLGDGCAGAEGQAARRDPPGSRLGPPQQQRQTRDDQGLEPDVRHDGLLDLHLVGVEQDRCGREGGQPARCAAAQQEQVQDHGHGQADEVLDHRDRIEVAPGQQHLEDHVVAERIVAGPGAEQVLETVDVQQGGLVRGQREAAQDQPGQQQHRDQPVPPRGRGGRPARAAPGSVEPGRPAVRPRRCRQRVRSPPAGLEPAVVRSRMTVIPVGGRR